MFLFFFFFFPLFSFRGVGGRFSFSGDLSARAHAQPHLLNIKENESELAKVDALLAAVGEELEANTLPPIGCPAERATRTHQKKKKTRRT